MASDNEKTHVLLMPCIISELGRCSAGTMLSESDVHSGTWTWLQDQCFLKSVSEIEFEADAEVKSDADADIDSDDKPQSGTNETSANDLLPRIKELLAASKLQKGKIAQAIGCDETVLESLLTDENGIEKNAGWYSLKTIPVTE